MVFQMSSWLAIGAEEPLRGACCLEVAATRMFGGRISSLPELNSTYIYIFLFPPCEELEPPGEVEEVPDVGEGVKNPALPELDHCWAESNFLYFY